MSTFKIADTQWRKIYTFLKVHPRTYANNQEATRRFVEGVHRLMRTGIQWRKLPA
ncbi:MAG: transposase [Chloroflexi bacterium]|nr:transposase [Chloroflexota bacterium]